MINLTLTQDEAEVLATILTMVGGDRTNSARKDAASITEKLAKVGVWSTLYLDQKYPVQSDRCSIRFLESTK